MAKKNTKNTRKRRGTEPRRDVYQEVTDRILAALDAGVPPWRDPVLSAGPPANLASRKPYRGVNVFLLMMAQAAGEHSSPWWLTFKQALDLGGNVRRGERSTRVVFWKVLEREETDDAGEVTEIKLPLVRFYSVFNAAQCEGITVPDAGRAPGGPHEPDLACDAIDRRYRRELGGPALGSGARRPLYRRGNDAVMMPDLDAFESAAEYHATLFHELAHSTGHPRRLGRFKEGESPDVPAYGREELVAEMAAAFLCAEGGISPLVIANQASYVDGWRRTIKGDKSLVVRSAAQAQRAADHVLGRGFEGGDGDENNG